MAGEMLKYYAVMENTPGYLPEAGPSFYQEFEDARGAAFELAQELFEGIWREGDPVATCHDDGDSITWELEDKARTHDLGRVVEVIPVWMTPEAAGLED